MDNVNKPAIKFFNEDEDYRRQSIYFFGDPNNKNEIYITSDNVECIRGEKIYYCYKGINIYADIDQCISINTLNDTIVIFENKKLAPPEEREYLLLLSYFDEGTNVYQGAIGRQAVFDFLKDSIEDIDIKKSLVLVETVALKDAINVYEFMSQCIVDGLVVNDDGFDIEEFNYVIEEIDE